VSRRIPALRAIAPAAAVLTMLAGCTVDPDYQRPSVAAPAQWQLDPVDAYWHPARASHAPLALD